MDSLFHSMKELFAQLGLDDDPAAIRAFIAQHRPLPLETRLFDAPFWSPSQSALIREKLQEDGDWSVLIDTLNTQLRASPA
ncbi:DUF2789 domain-containing protein [uncultured Sphaerotilus sp.]|uniref:DUF2789 domain-containing protein n=1 Tax=uncultured Sphaerotilus sp. TaxID=474984 RepID=UPI0030CA27A9